MRSLSTLIYEDADSNPEDGIWLLLYEYIILIKTSDIIWICRYITYEVPSVIQTLLVCICVGGPLVFLQCFIGQYTKKGCIAIGSMLPAMYGQSLLLPFFYPYGSGISIFYVLGFGYSMLVISFYNCALTLYHTAPSLIYIFSSIMNYPEIPWMLCGKTKIQSNLECFSRKDIFMCQTCDISSEPCFDMTKSRLSAGIFK